MNTNSRDNWFEKNPKKTLASVIIIGFLVIDFGTAAFLKAIGKFKPSYVTSSIREAYYRKSHPLYHHTLAAKVSNYTAEWGGRDYIINTNSLGFKDHAPRDVSLATQQKRILIIGDSFTEGVGVEYPDTFVGLIQKNMPQLEILNASATSYSPIIYYRKMKHLLQDVKLKFDEVWVFIDLSDIEDEALGYRFDEHENVVSRSSIARVGVTTKKSPEPNQSEAIKPEMSVKEFFTQYTVFLGQLRNLSAYIKSITRPWDRALHKRRGLWTIDETLYKEYGKTGLEHARQHMSMLKKLLDSHNIKLTIGVYPWPDQIYNRDLDSKQVQVWEQWAQHHQVSFVNLFPAFINKEDAKGIITDNFFTGDVHWNRHGHRIVYESLKPYLLQPRKK